MASARGFINPSKIGFHPPRKAAWLNAAALHYIFEHRLVHLYPTIKKARDEDLEPLVQETCRLLIGRIADESRAAISKPIPGGRP